MHILYVSQYFPPEPGAPAARVYELAREWTRAGHRVTVLTGFPNHPDGVVPAEYRRLLRRGTIRERMDGIDVVRTWLYPVPNRSAVERIASYSSFFASAALRGLFLSRPDVVIGTSPQLLTGLAAWILARRFRRPFVLEVRDLWPESLPASGVSHPGSRLYRALDALARFLYRSADLIVPVTEPIGQAIAARRPGAPLAVIENGVDTNLFMPAASAAEAKATLGLSGHFVVSAIGTIGAAHALDVALDAAAVLRERDPDVLLLFVGGGADRARLEARARAEGLTNVRFDGSKPRPEIPRYIAASEVCLVHLRRNALFDTVLPSKLLEFMASARPVIAGVSGLARAIVEQSGAGLVIPSEDAGALADAIDRMRADPDRAARFGASGRSYVLRHFTRRAKAEAYLHALAAIAPSAVTDAQPVAARSPSE